MFHSTLTAQSEQSLGIYIKERYVHNHLRSALNQLQEATSLRLPTYNPGSHLKAYIKRFKR